MQDFQELVECLEVSNHCLKLLTRALLPEAAMEHALRAVNTDDLVRRWKPHPNSEWELLYGCARGQVDWNSPDGENSITLLLPCMLLLLPALRFAQLLAAAASAMSSGEVPSARGAA